jgi:hypothetical protein
MNLAAAPTLLSLQFRLALDLLVIGLARGCERAAFAHAAHADLHAPHVAALAWFGHSDFLSGKIRTGATKNCENRTKKSPLKAGIY